MAGWCTSVRTVRHLKVYGTPTRTVTEERAPTPDDVNPAHHWTHLQAAPNGSAGPCGSVAKLKDADGWPWRAFVDEVRAYVARWGHAPLGIQQRDRAAKPNGYGPRCIQKLSG